VLKVSQGRKLDRTFPTEQEAIDAAESFASDPQRYLYNNQKTTGVYKWDYKRTDSNGERWKAEKTINRLKLARTFPTEAEAIAAVESFTSDPQRYLENNQNMAPSKKKAKTTGVYKSPTGESWKAKKTINRLKLERTFPTEAEAIAAVESFTSDPQRYLDNNQSIRAQKAAAVQKTKDSGGLSHGARANELQLAEAYAAMNHTTQLAPKKRPRQPPAAGGGSSGQAAPAPVMIFISVEQESRVAAAVGALVPPLPQEMIVKQEPNDDREDTEEVPEPTQTLDLRPIAEIYADTMVLFASDELF
jgi:hypothetical protein